ncbi:Uncharacterised protein [uncultured archaeon]|nr:Uncharacterised protein [uncultured archaeon]
MLASHYIAKELLDAFDDAAAFDEKIRKYAERYTADAEFQDLYGKYQDLKLKPAAKKKEDIKRILQDLERTRKIDSSGGGRLPFAGDYRHMGGGQTRR